MTMITAEVAGATSKIFPFRCYVIADGKPKTDLVFNTSGISAKYTVSGGTPTVITLATATQGTWATGGLIAVNSVGGMYELHLPNAALASAGRVQVDIWDTTGTPVFICTAIYIDVLGVDPRSAAAIQSDVTKWNGTTVATPDTAGYPKTTLKSGTGAGEVSVTSGVVSANLAQILGTALTETAGLIAAGFKQFFNIASPTSTMNTITAVTTTTTATNVTTVNGLGGGVITAASIAASAITSTKFAADAIDANALKADAASEIATAVQTLATATPLAVNLKKINDVSLTGNGVAPKFGV